MAKRKTVTDQAFWTRRRTRKNPPGLTFVQAIAAARKAGADIGDTSGFEPWLIKVKLNKRSPQIKRKLKRQFWLGVEEGDPQPERSSSKTMTHQGVRIWKEGEIWRVSVDPASEFDSLKEAKRFIGAAHLNPRSAFHEAYREARTSSDLRRRLQHTLGPAVMQDLGRIYRQHLQTARQLRRVKSEIRRSRVSA